MEAHRIYDEEPLTEWVPRSFKEGDRQFPLLATVHSASRESVDLVLSQTPGDADGRSEWIWVRLTNGDLILGVFPCGETYFSVEVDAEYPGA